MKLIRTLQALLFVAVVSIGVALPSAPVFAADNQEAQIAGVGEAIDGLWGFIDESADMPDEDFYPEVVYRIQDTEKKVGEVYDYLATTDESGAVAEAIAAIRSDVGNIHDQLGVLRQAALDKDSYGFDIANTDLEQLVEIYNSDIDAYTAAKYGSRAINDIAGYAGLPAFLFALTCVLFAWAFYANKEEDEPLKEVARQLRWRLAYSMTGLLAAVLIPSGVYFTTEGEPLAWLWIPALIALCVLLFHLAMYIKVWVLFRRHSQA
jgi:hypothetical protein